MRWYRLKETIVAYRLCGFLLLIPLLMEIIVAISAKGWWWLFSLLPLAILLGLIKWAPTQNCKREFYDSPNRLVFDLKKDDQNARYHAALNMCTTKKIDIYVNIFFEGNKRLHDPWDFSEMCAIFFTHEDDLMLVQLSL